MARRMKDEGHDISHLLEKENLTSCQILKSSGFFAYFVDGGELQNAIDFENGLIKNELIDGTSDKINSFADDLMYLEREGKKMWTNSYAELIAFPTYCTERQ